MLHHRISIITILLAALFLASCANHKTAATLNDVETYIQARPDSALATIRAIDTTTLTTRSLRAHYALLHAMALDKNWIDTTDVNVVMPAVEYYANHGTADQKMKANYYLGRIYENQHDLNKSILAYTVAEEVSGGSNDDMFKGLLNLGISLIYSKVYQVDKALEYAYKGLDYFESAQDTTRYNLSFGRLAMLYQQKEDWETADSLYKESLILAARDTGSMRLYLSQYASMKVVQPDPDPEGAIDLLKRRALEYKRPLSFKDYGIYAYASEMLGDKQTCDKILKMLYERPDSLRRDTHFMEYRIARHQGDYPLAIERFNRSYLDQNETVKRLFNNSINQSLKEYYENQAIETKHQAQVQRLYFVVILLAFLLVLGAILLDLRRKREKEKQESERLVQIAEETARMMQQSNAQLFKSQFAPISDLCKTYFKTEKSGEFYQKEAVYRKVTEILSNISSDDQLHAQFEAQINHDLDNIIDHLKADLGEMSPTDERFLCYMIAGFDSSTIATILNLSMSNVYTKKSRLKDRIRQLDSPYKEQYQMII